MGGTCGQRREHRDRIELRLREIRGAVFGDGDVVGQKDRVHQPAFGSSCDIGVVGQAEDAADIVIDDAPGGFVIAVRPDESVEVQWPHVHRFGSFNQALTSTPRNVV